MVFDFWKRIPRFDVESPTLEIFKTQLDMALSNLLWLTLLCEGVEPTTLPRCIPSSSSLWWCVCTHVRKHR